MTDEDRLSALSEKLAKKSDDDLRSKINDAFTKLEANICYGMKSAPVAILDIHLNMNAGSSKIRIGNNEIVVDKRWLFQCIKEQFFEKMYLSEREQMYKEFLANVDFSKPRKKVRSKPYIKTRKRQN